MDSLDLLIIYLACGAPFGVYYFLQNRTHSNSGSFWFKTFFNFLFWMPLAFLFFRRQKVFNFFSFFKFYRTDASSIKAEQLYTIQKQIEKMLPKSDLYISIYEFREIIERYIGLSLTAKNIAGTISEQEKEIFRITPKRNVELGSICLKRRNRRRLSFHQTEARKDFLHLVNQLNESTFEKDKLRQKTIELVRTLEDSETQNELEEIFFNSLQTDNRLNVQKLESDIWKPEIHIPLTGKSISTRIQAMKAETRFHGKD